MSEVKLSIDGIQDHVKSIVEAQVANALAGGGDVLTQIIGRICTEERYNKDSSGPMTRLQEMIENQVAGYVREEVQRTIEGRDEEFKAEVRRQIREKHSELLKKFATATLSIGEDSYRGEIKIIVKLER